MDKSAVKRPRSRADELIGARVREVLDAQGRRGAWVMDALGVANRMEVTRRMSGVKAFTVAELSGLARACGVAVSDLVPDDLEGDVGTMPASDALVAARALGARAPERKVEMLGEGKRS